MVDETALWAQGEFVLDKSLLPYIWSLGLSGNVVHLWSNGGYLSNGPHCTNFTHKKPFLKYLIMKKKMSSYCFKRLKNNKSDAQTSLLGQMNCNNQLLETVRKLSADFPVLSGWSISMIYITAIQSPFQAIVFVKYEGRLFAIRNFHAWNVGVSNIFIWMDSSWPQ